MSAYAVYAVYAWSAGLGSETVSGKFGEIFTLNK
jgi:hypothetical protein